VLYEFLFKHFLKGAAVSKSPLSQLQQQRLVPFSEVVKVTQPGYSVAFTHDNTLAEAGATFSSPEKAEQHLRQKLGQNPALAGSLHVIPSTELEEAA
jgi:hypothetical protein